MHYAKKLLFGVFLGITLLLCGCASTTHPVNSSSPANASPPAVNVDPYEKFNRAMFGFNDKLDHWILRPIAKGYDKITPAPVHKSINNFFDNLDLLMTFPNDFLQAKFAFAAQDFWRFIINSSVGIGGLFDPATHLGVNMRNEDFGLTLAYWSGLDGFKPQPYLVIPFLGSSTVRDAFGKIPDSACWPFIYIDPWYLTYAVYAGKVINERANLLPADQLVQQAFDPYIFVRSAYLQTRQNAILKNWQETHPDYVPPAEAPPDIDDIGPLPEDEPATSASPTPVTPSEPTSSAAKETKPTNVPTPQSEKVPRTL